MNRYSRHIRTDVAPEMPYGSDRDACAIYMSVRKQGQSTFGTLKRSLSALGQMGHRTGFVNGEGDGAGIQTDIPRRLWAKKLSQNSLRSSLAVQPGFWVGHLFLPAGSDLTAYSDIIDSRFNQAGLNLLILQPGKTRPEVLGRNAQSSTPVFLQLAGWTEAPDLERKLLHIQNKLEAEFPFSFASLSPHSVIYKVRGSVEALGRYYPDLQSRDYDTLMVLCHARYSTNTVSTFERSQPFSLIAHNGEINTIKRLRQEADQIGVVLPRGGSDTQDLNHTLHTLCVEHNLDLIEAVEMVFPPVPAILNQIPDELAAVYTRLRQSFGPYAQGPAGIVGRHGNTAIASVDTMGLRPLWFVETEKEYIFSSERGAIQFDNRVDTTHALAPGEKMALKINRGQHVEILNHADIMQHVMKEAFQRESPQLARQYWQYWGQSNKTHVRPVMSAVGLDEEKATQEPSREISSRLWQENPWQSSTCGDVFETAFLAANGWLQEHVDDIQLAVKQDKDPVSSLGFDGPLAVLSKTAVNVSDYFKETVAVVTNPAIDRGREMEAFSTQVLLGARPDIGQPPQQDDILLTLETPLLAGGHALLGSQETTQAVARKSGTLTIEEVSAVFNEHCQCLVLGVQAEESVQGALERLGQEAVAAVQQGAQCLILDDCLVQSEGQNFLDPHLAAGYVDGVLRKAHHQSRNLRRRTGLIVRSAAVRNLHDIVLLVGFGVDAVNPYAMLAAVAQMDDAADEKTQIELQSRILNNSRLGLEKVISTMGCHELRGYGRVCSSIGLSPEIAAIFDSPNYFGSQKVGLTWEQLDAQSRRRGQLIHGRETIKKLEKTSRFTPRFRNKVVAYTNLKGSYQEVLDTYQQLCDSSPIALRQALGVRRITDVVNPANIDISIQNHRMPLIISAMSFGSQGETAYKAYAEAADRLDIICVNGEGGELPEMLDKYRKNRAQQVASGRFGVYADFLNSTAVIEIKIGQGAKPGEGGMLPAEKVTRLVATARHTPPQVPLLSPSNNHDLYSIEDLAQLIEELRVVNPKARISVKMPVVPDIGVIAVGVAKAGADILNLSGYDGGTGAARKHAMQYVGLPAEIGVIQSHRALVEAGLRHRVEIWCDGGMKTGEDAVKMILLGANRVGFATMAMVALGCTICRKCEAGNCPVGITTQISNQEEAKARGVKKFTPLEFEEAVRKLVLLFEGIGEEMRSCTARLGVLRLQDLVGRADLLEQLRCQDQIDLSSMMETAPMKPRPGLEPGVGRLLTRPRNSLTRFLSDLILETVLDDEREVTYQDEVMAYDRALGSRLVGELSRTPAVKEAIDVVHLRFGPSSIAGNGFAAWVCDHLDILIEGGAQDGVAKGAYGGRVAVMKGLNYDGQRIDGSVGKSFAYGAQRGTLIVQGDADSRACIRLSGADVIFGGEIRQPVDDSNGLMGINANLKGYACEYMTSGRVVILGDPGPWAFAGMTGGVVYQLLTPEMGFDLHVLKKRLARGAFVSISPVAVEDMADIRTLLGYYVEALEQTHQDEVVERINLLCEEQNLLTRFVKILPQLA